MLHMIIFSFERLGNFICLVISINFQVLKLSSETFLEGEGGRVFFGLFYFVRQGITIYVTLADLENFPMITLQIYSTFPVFK